LKNEFDGLNIKLSKSIESLKNHEQLVNQTKKQLNKKEQKTTLRDSKIKFMVKKKKIENTFVL
jgi:hypothetical protein